MNKNKAFAWLVMGLIVVVLWMWVVASSGGDSGKSLTYISEDDLMAPYIERYGEQFEYRIPQSGVRVRIFWWEDAQVYVQIEYRDRDNAVDGEYGWFVKKELL
jgi:hypothetical protein